MSLLVVSAASVPLMCPSFSPILAESPVAVAVRRRFAELLGLLALVVRLLGRKGYTDVVTSLIAVVVAIVIGAFILGVLGSTTSTLPMTPQANQTVQNIFTTTWAAYSLLIILPIVLVASVIIGMFVRRGRR